MPTSNEIAPAAAGKPDYEFGNRPHIEVIRVLPRQLKEALDPHSSLEIENIAEPLFTEEQLYDKVLEVADNYTIFADPESTEQNPRFFGGTILNKHLIDEGVPAILVVGTSASSLYDEERNPNNEGNAIELAYLAFKYPDRPIVFIESPGNGNSVDFTDEEYKEAAKDGRLVHAEIDDDGKLIDYEAFETVAAIARAVQHAGISISHVSSNASGAHLSTAIAAALERDSLERAFLYNPTNISDRTFVGLTAATLWEVWRQSRYEKASKDPLRLTKERKEMALKALSTKPKRKVDQALASTHNPVKLLRQQKMLRRGNKHGASAAVHAVAAQDQHPGLRQTFIFPEFAAQYKRSEDFYEFMRRIEQLGGTAVEMTDIESLKIPMGQYGHTHYPTVRQTFEGYAFNRK